MSSPGPLRRYVVPLADWARDGPEQQARTRKVMDPLGEFLPWARALIAHYYWPSLDHPRGMTMAQFIDDCIERVFLWAKPNAGLLEQPDFSDSQLEARIRFIARNQRATLWREKHRLKKMERLDAYEEEWRNRKDYPNSGLRRTPEGLVTPPEILELEGFWDLEDEFKRACWVMPRFNRALRRNKRMRELLAWLYRLGRRLGRRRHFPSYWYVWRILRRRHDHLPSYALGYLRAHLPHVPHKVINSRLGYLRRALATFLSLL